MTGKIYAVMWLDPGKTTGIASYLADADNFQSGQLDFLGTCQTLERWATSRYILLKLGWEKYIVTGGRRTGLPEYSYEVIGVAKWMCSRYGIEPLPSVPSSARIVASHAMLKKVGWYAPGNGHANDAAQHLLAYYLRTRTLPSQLHEKLFTHQDHPGMLDTAPQEVIMNE